MMYYRLPSGAATSNIRLLIPHVINPQFLSDAELELHGVARCKIETPTVEWWQKKGEKLIDTSSTPHVITWSVEDRDLDEVKGAAWQRIKEERETRQSGLMPYTYPDGSLHTNRMSEKTIRDLSSSTTAAIALSSTGVTDPIMPWTVEENITHWLTPEQMIAFGLAATQWYSAIHATSQQIRAAIYGAQTVAEVVQAAQWPES